MIAWRVVNDVRRRAYGRQAFTLVELLVVLAIITVITGMAVPDLRSVYDRVIVSCAASNLADTMRYAQGRAVMKGLLHRVTFNSARTAYVLEQQTEGSSDSRPRFGTVSNTLGRLKKIPMGITVSIGVSTVNFYPDGTIDPVRIFLGNEDRTYTISTMEQHRRVRIFNFKLYQYNPGRSPHISNPRGCGGVGRC